MNADEPGALCFVDSNVWLYAFIPSQDEAKAAVAGDLLRSREIVVSTQVVNEVCVNLIRKAKMAAQIEVPGVSRRVSLDGVRFISQTPLTSNLSSTNLSQRYHHPRYTNRSAARFSARRLVFRVYSTTPRCCRTTVILRLPASET